MEDGEKGLGQKEDEDILQFGLAKEAGKGVARIEEDVFQHLAQAFLVCQEEVVKAADHSSFPILVEDREAESEIEDWEDQLAEDDGPFGALGQGKSFLQEEVEADADNVDKGIFLDHQGQQDDESQPPFPLAQIGINQPEQEGNQEAIFM